MKFEQQAYPLTERYLEQIEALTAEIRVAIAAIAANELGTLQQSVSKQQQICLALCQTDAQVVWKQSLAMSQMMVGARTGQQRALESDEEAMGARIRDAAASLRVLNLRYAALLKHARDSVQLFAGLCQGYAGLVPQSGSLSTGRLGWSCEL